MSAKLWLKMSAAAVVMCVGGPALVWYVTPTEEEIFKRYNPELQKRSLENRQQKQEDFNHFVNKLKEYSKSDRPIWEVAAQDEARNRDRLRLEQEQLKLEAQKIQDEMKKQATTPR